MYGYPTREPRAASHVVRSIAAANDSLYENAFLNSYSVKKYISLLVLEEYFVIRHNFAEKENTIWIMGSRDTRYVWKESK
jgi:hypothetical protein